MPTCLRVCDCVYYGMDSFGKERARWRITHHLKRIEDTFDDQDKPDDPVEAIIYEVIEEERLREKFSRWEKGLSHTRRFRYQVCTQEEATHVSLVGICGAEASVEDCEFIQEVPWSQEFIKEQRASAVSSFWLGHIFDWRWE